MHGCELVPLFFSSYCPRCDEVELPAVGTELNHMDAIAALELGAVIELVASDWGGLGKAFYLKQGTMWLRGAVFDDDDWTTFTLMPLDEVFDHLRTWPNPEGYRWRVIPTPF